MWNKLQRWGVGTQDHSAFLWGWSFSQCGIPQSFTRVLAPSKGRKAGGSLDPPLRPLTPASCPLPEPEGTSLDLQVLVWAFQGPFCFGPQPALLPSKIASPEC